jgi:hypothetical protein
MPTAPLRSTTPAIDIYARLAQYPILCDRIRLRLREELFSRGVVAKTEFEQEVKHLAMESQRREGLSNPLYQEDEGTWQRRLDIMRDYHTDYYVANNLGMSIVEQIVEEVLRNQQVETGQIDLTFNPEIAPWALLFQQGEVYDTLPPPEKERIKHHLEEIKVVLIKRLLSDQLPFIAVAKNVLTIGDLRWIYERLIGRGKIGGKGSGMVLAWKILQMNSPELGPNLGQFVRIPETYFIGSELIYEFIYLNKLERFVNQKYLPDAERRAQYPQIVAAYMAGNAPDYLAEQLREVLGRLHGRPFIVRSSSLLEDHLDYSFAGKYASIFCPNQGSPAENLADLLNAIRRIYASTFDPNAMAEREKYGLIDYDERMAIMIQPLVGEQHGRYFFPTIVGVGLSENPYYRETGTRKEDGCLRLVWGFAGRVTDAEFLQQSCIIALSHPRKRTSDPDCSLLQTNQESIKVVDLETNQFEVKPIGEILEDKHIHWEDVATAVIHDHTPTYQVTFETLTKDHKFIGLMRQTLQRLQNVYEKPVKLEFTLMIDHTPAGPNYQLYILQCHTV